MTGKQVGPIQATRRVGWGWAPAIARYCPHTGTGIFERKYGLLDRQQPIPRIQKTHDSHAEYFSSWARDVKSGVVST